MKLSILIRLLCLATIFSTTYSFSQSEPENVTINTFKNLLATKQVKEAEKYLQNNIPDWKTDQDAILVYYEVSKTYNNHQFYELSIEYAKSGIEESLKSDQELIIELYQVLIINHIDLENYNLAETIYWESEAYLSNASNKVVANHYNIIAEIYRLNEKYSESIYYYEQAIAKNSNFNYGNQLAINYNNLGLVYIAVGETKKGEQYLNKASILIDSLNLELRKASINISYGELYFMRGNFVEAIDYYKKTLTFNLSNHPDQNEIYKDVYYGLYKCYENQGLFEEGLLAYKNYEVYKQKIYNQSAATAVLENQILDEREIHKSELQFAEEKLVAEKEYNNMVTLLFAVLILIVSLIAYILWIRNIKNKQKVEIEINKNRIQLLELDRVKLREENLQHELKQSEQQARIKEVESIRLQEKIDSKNRELASATIHLMSKNEILNQINDKLEASQNRTTEQGNNVYREVKNIILDSIRLDEDWKIFSKHFTEVHPRFFEEIKLKWPAITSDELKLCAFLKIQLSSKEIARLMNITLEAVNKRRNRLRKKMSIPSSQDFYSFFLENNCL